eukprot:950779_1
MTISTLLFACLAHATLTTHTPHGTCFVSTHSRSARHLFMQQRPFHHRYCNRSHSMNVTRLTSTDMSTQTGDEPRDTNSFNSYQPGSSAESELEETSSHIIIVRQIIRKPPRSSLTKIKSLLISNQLGFKIIFFIFQIFCGLISLNLCVFITNFDCKLFPTILRVLLCLNTMIFAAYNLITCITSILYLDVYNLSFLFSMDWWWLFMLFYILSLRISLSAIINLYFMNIIIWSWVHSRLRGMARLIRDRSGSGSEHAASSLTPPNLCNRNQIKPLIVPDLIIMMIPIGGHSYIVNGGIVYSEERYSLFF